VILKPTPRELEVAHLIGKMLGGQVNIIPRIFSNPFRPLIQIFSSVGGPQST